MNWLKKLKAWCSPKKNANELPPIAPAYLGASAFWNLKSFERLAWPVKITARPPASIPLGPNASAPATKPEPASEPGAATMSNVAFTPLPPEKLHHPADPPGVERRWDRNGRLRSFTRTDRMKELTSQHFNVTRTYFFDPQCDVPLEPDFEKTCDQMGAVEYVKWLLKNYGGQVNPMPTTEYEGRRAVRKYIRNMKDYRGEKFIQ